MEGLRVNLGRVKSGIQEFYITVFHLLEDNELLLTDVFGDNYKSNVRGVTRLGSKKSNWTCRY